MGPEILVRTLEGKGMANKVKTNKWDMVIKVEEAVVVEIKVGARVEDGRPVVICQNCDTQPSGHKPLSIRSIIFSKI